MNPLHYPPDVLKVPPPSGCPAAEHNDIFLISSLLALSAVRDKGDRNPSPFFIPWQVTAFNLLLPSSLQPLCLSFLLYRPLEWMQAPTCHSWRFPLLVYTLGLEEHIHFCFLVRLLTEFIFLCLIHLLSSRLIFSACVGPFSIDAFNPKLLHHIQYFENQINSFPAREFSLMCFHLPGLSVETHWN